jgi:hypothetical protein
MKITAFFIIIFSVFGCNQSKKQKVADVKPNVLNHFGILKIGMSIADFKSKKITSVARNNDYEIGYDIENIKVNDEIILANVYIEFKHNKLAYIGTECNDAFITFLKHNYGEKSGEIQTNTDDIFCGIENFRSTCVMGLYEKNWRPDYN